MLNNYNDSIENIQNAYILCKGLTKFLRCIFNHFMHFLQQFSISYLKYEALAYQIISNGFVNAIPIETKEDNAENDKNLGENCGMGNADKDDATGATDVSNQIDETGQIEGLKVKIFIFFY